MKLLLDENLSPKLVELLSRHFPESSHGTLCNLRGQSDAEVWDYAGRQGYILVSKDNDFRQMAVLRGAPPKVIHLRIGNSPTHAALELLIAQHDKILEFSKDAESSLLILQAPI